MERRPIGRVHALYRDPVKSMQGERLNDVEIGPQGVIGDRTYALREAYGRGITVKEWPALLEYAARSGAPHATDAPVPLSITVSDGRTVQAQDADTSAVLSAVLGHQVGLKRAQADQHHRAAIDPATVFGDVPVEALKPGYTAATLPDSFALPPGSCFDAARLHVLASGTLAHLRTLMGEDAPVDARRFRPNLLVGTDPGLEGFLKDTWLEGALEIGVHVRIVPLRPTPRCVMTTHRQAEIGRDLRVLRTTAQHHRAEVGVWAAVGAPGTVQVGDPVVRVGYLRLTQGCLRHRWSHRSTLFGVHSIIQGASIVSAHVRGHQPLVHGVAWEIVPCGHTPAQAWTIRYRNRERSGRDLSTPHATRTAACETH